MSREEWFYHPLSPQKDYTFTYRNDECTIEKQNETSYNPMSQVPDFWLNIIKNNESQLMTPDLLKEIKETLQMAINVISEGDFEEGYCCCGSPCDTHGMGDGHGPVDAGIYYNQMLPIQRIEKLLERLTPPEESDIIDSTNQ